MGLQDETFFQGQLLFPPQGMLGQLKKTWQRKFCQLFKASKYGIERLEVYDNEDEVASQQHSPRIVTLEACVKIAQSNQPRVFTVVTKTGVHHFGCYSDLEMTDWIEAFQRVAFNGEASGETIEKDNDLYCTSGEGVFSVKLVETEASKRCRMETKPYTLVVATSEIKLMDGDTITCTWPYKYIRKYGYRDGKFTFEAGRKCESGEGVFRLEHRNQQEIFRCISSKMKSMKKMLSGENSPNIDCNDVQYHAALSMEAGSRSPLPPSPNSSNNLIDIDFSTISQNSQKHVNACSSSSLDSISFIKPPPPIIKPKPAKPSKKYIFNGLMEKKCFENEFTDSPSCGQYKKFDSTSESPDAGRRKFAHPIPIDFNERDDDKQHPYDLVEVRSDAWKTHGLENVPHTERIDSRDAITNYNQESTNFNNENIKNSTTSTSALSNVDDCESQYEIVDSLTTFSGNQGCNLRPKRKPSVEQIVPVAASPIIHNNVGQNFDSSNYDKLQHFGSMHKLNNSNPGYKIPNVSHSNSQCDSVISGDDGNVTSSNYDVVDDLCGIRLADDTRHGYGIIRKKINVPVNSTTTNAGIPKQRVFNDTEYAIVSKPKRV